MSSISHITLTRWYLPGLMGALALSLALGAPVSAQPVTCNGLTATIVATTPGRIDGTAGVDVIVGTDGNDEIVGLVGNDTICAGAGDDIIVWNPGDGSDVVEGQAGNDTLQFNGSNANEQIDLSANGERLRFFRDVASIIIDADDLERVAFAALGGTDTITVNSLAGIDVTEVNLNLAGTIGGSTGDNQADSVIVNGTADADSITIAGNASSVAVTGLSAGIWMSAAEPTLDRLTVNGLNGDDTISAKALATTFTQFLSLVVAPADAAPAAATTSALLAANEVISLTLNGGPGIDSLSGGAGNDQVVGGTSTDTVLLGPGDDSFTWNPGDGSDTVEGQAGADTLIFNGSNGSEQIDLSANGARLRFSRDIGNVVVETDDLEQVTFAALGGADTITINSLAATDVTSVTLNLAGSGGVGDTAADNIIVNGTTGADTVTISGSAGTVALTGLSAGITIGTVEAASDGLTVNTLAGADNVTASALQAGVVSLVMDGGTDGDSLIGSRAADIIFGGDGADQVNGSTGNDTAFLGAGDDSFTWNPGDGSDTIEGQAGIDTLLFNGANASEQISLSANGGRLLFFRDVASITMDMDNVEQVTFTAIGGADTITVNNLAGTDVTAVTLNLAAAGGTGDGAIDTVIVSGTAGNDIVTINGSAGALTVAGLSASVAISGAEGALDRLTVNGQAGDDVVDASGLVAGVLSLTIDGAAGDDELIGSAGDDTIFGGSDDDTLIGGPGNDTLDGGTGNNIIIQD